MRPQPPEGMFDGGDRFEPSAELRDWIVATFISPDGDLHNPDHAHLEQASIGVLWTNCDNAKAMKVVIGQAELMPPMAMGKWQRARAVQQIEEWFGEVPDFLITFHALAAAVMDDVSFCALVEHELYHCAQTLDQYGMPRFNKDTGLPVFGIKGHDVEEFIGVVARYGATAEVARLVEAASDRPTVAMADIRGACGNCLRAVA